MSQVLPKKVMLCAFLLITSLLFFVGKRSIHHPTSQWYVHQAPIFWAYPSGIETLEPTLFCHDAGSCLPSTSDQARVGTLTKWIWGLTWCTLWSTNLGLISTNNNETFRRLASSKLLVSWLELDRPIFQKLPSTWTNAPREWFTPHFTRAKGINPLI